MKKVKKNNVVTFPGKISEAEREVEAIIFAAAEPLSIETIESKISKKIRMKSYIIDPYDKIMNTTRLIIATSHLSKTMIVQNHIITISHSTRQNPDSRKSEDIHKQ